MRFYFARIAVWWVDQFKTRPCTKTEGIQVLQYARLMVDVLTGNCSFYGRDREEVKGGK